MTNRPSILDQAHLQNVVRTFRLRIEELRQLRPPGQFFAIGTIEELLETKTANKANKVDWSKEGF